jgi:hypothetical protein
MITPRSTFASHKIQPCLWSWTTTHHYAKNRQLSWRATMTWLIRYPEKQSGWFILTASPTFGSVASSKDGVIPFYGSGWISLAHYYLRWKAHMDSPLHIAGVNNKSSRYGGQSIPHPNYWLRMWIGESRNLTLRHPHPPSQNGSTGTNWGSWFPLSH